MGIFRSKKFAKKSLEGEGGLSFYSLLICNYSNFSSLALSVCLSVCVCLSVSLSVRLSTLVCEAHWFCIAEISSVKLPSSVYLSVCLSVSLSVCLSVCLSTLVFEAHWFCFAKI